MNKVLVHVCCGVCSMYPIYSLSLKYDVTVFYTNSNIYPYEEYQKRIENLKKYLALYKGRVKLIIDSYDDNYQAYLAKYGSDKEGMGRCFRCYLARMERCFKYASDNGYDYVTTIMSISNHKNYHYMSRIGQRLSLKYPKVKYLDIDFKKNNGYNLNQAMNKSFEIYHQDYCGCLFQRNEKNTCK